MYIQSPNSIVSSPFSSILVLEIEMGMAVSQKHLCYHLRTISLLLQLWPWSSNLVVPIQFLYCCERGNSVCFDDF